MKKEALVLGLLTCLYGCFSSASIWGDIDLGKNLYYMTEPAFNSINLSTSPSDPMRSSINILKDLETLGFNDDAIFCSTFQNGTRKYHKIDKNGQWNIEITDNGKELITPKIVEITDSTTYIQQAKDNKVEIKHTKVIQAEYGWK